MTPHSGYSTSPQGVSQFGAVTWQLQDAAILFATKLGQTTTTLALPAGVLGADVRAVQVDLTGTVLLAVGHHGATALDLYRWTPSSAWVGPATHTWAWRDGVVSGVGNALFQRGDTDQVVLLAFTKASTSIAFNQVFVSVDDGRTFVARPAPPNTMNEVVRDVAYGAGRIVAVTGNQAQHVWTSADDGRTWTAPKVALAGAGTVTVHFGHAVLTAASTYLPAFDCTTIPCQLGLLVSTNNGASFRATGTPLSLADPNAAVAGTPVSLSGSTWWVLDGRTVITSSDAGAHWTTAGQAPAGATQLVGLGDRTASVLVGTEILGTTDGGVTWQRP